MLPKSSICHVIGFGYSPVKGGKKGDEMKRRRSKREGDAFISKGAKRF